MSSEIVAAADAVKDALNAATFTEDFTATRKWIPKVSLEDLSTLTVTVAPKDYARENETRGAARRTMQIDIGVQKRLETTTNPEDPTRLDEVDDLMELVEDIAGFFQPGAYGGARWVRSEIPEPMYDRDLLDQHHIFQSVVTVTLTRL